MKSFFKCNSEALEEGAEVRVQLTSLYTVTKSEPNSTSHEKTPTNSTAFPIPP